MRCKYFFILTTICFLLFAFTGCFPEMADSDKIYKREHELFNDTSSILFEMLDEKIFDAGAFLNIFDTEYIEGNENALKNAELVDLLKKLSKNAEIAQVYVVDKNVILYSHGAYFQSVSGIVKTRNNPELKANWGNTGFDGCMTYKEIDAGTFSFSDGL